MILILPHRLNSAQWREFSAQNSKQIVIWYEAVVAHLKIFIRALYGHYGMFSEWPIYRSRFVIRLDVCRYSNRLSQYPQSCHLSHTFSIARFIYIASQHVINPWRQRDMERQLCGVCKDCRRHRGLIAYWAIRREQRGRSCTAVQLSCSKLQAGAHLQCEKKWSRTLQNGHSLYLVAIPCGEVFKPIIRLRCSKNQTTWKKPEV